MPEPLHRVQVEQADWPTLMPFTHLFRGFRMAVQPAKLLLALMLVLLTYLGGLGLDLVWGPQVYENEFTQYRTLSGEAYENWYTTVEEARAAEVERYRSRGQVLPDHRRGVFETTLQLELAAFQRLVTSATSLNFGLGDFLSGRGLQSDGVLGALGTMIVGVPGWLYHTHPLFLGLFLLYAFAVTALFGGAIARLAAVQAGRDLHPSAFTGLKFAGSRYAWFFLAPIIPLVVVLVTGLLVALGGLLFFNLPVLDVIGGLLFGLALLGGLVIALVLIGLFVGAPLLFPALAVEGTDAFDAISRAFNYVLGRPWRYLFYNAVMIVYGAVTYLFVGLIVYLTLWATKVAAGFLVFTDAGDEQSRLDAILPDPRLGELLYTPDWEALDVSGDIAAAIVLVWVKLLIAILPAYAVSFFFCEQTWIYLLLRRSADGTEYEEVYLDTEEPQPAPAPPEKLEPTDSLAADASTDTTTTSAAP